MGITEAIAAIVALPDAKAQLNRDPVAFGQRYGLTSAELAMLTKASPVGLRFVHNEHRTARLETLQAILPRTLRLLRPTPSAVLGPYMAQVPWETTSIPAEARRLLEWLSSHGGLDPALADLARYETLLYELAEDPSASRHALAVRDSGQPSLVASARPRLSAAARIASFDHDVTVTPPTRLAQPMHLLAVKVPDRWGPRIYRLSGEATELVLLCDGERTVSELTDSPTALMQLLACGALNSVDSRGLANS